VRPRRAAWLTTVVLVAAFATSGAVACWPQQEGLPPSPDDLRERLARSGPPRRLGASPEGKDVPAWATSPDASLEPSAEPSVATGKNKAERLLGALVEASERGDRGAVRELSSPACFPGSCEDVVSQSRVTKVVELFGPRPDDEGRRAFGRLRFDAPHGRGNDLYVLLQRDCALVGTPFRLVGATPRLEVARAFYDARVPPCTEGPRRAPVPSPFDPSGSPVVAPRKGDGGADGSANGAL
jgi:hypothetical protein